MHSYVRLFLGSVIVALLLSVTPAPADDFTLDGYRNCSRATNGKAYCQRLGSEVYYPVSDAFLLRFDALHAAANRPPAPPPVVNNLTNNTTNVVVVQQLEAESSQLRGMMDLYKSIVQEQMHQQSVDSACSSVSGVAQQAISVLNAKVLEAQTQFSEKTTELSHYMTSVRPNDPDLHITARRASELFPKIPYYIPGTPETGEFWLEPNITDTGELSFMLKFVDPKSTRGDKVRGTITMTSSELDVTRSALCKSAAWARQAHENGVAGSGRELTKRVVCFPEAKCPPEGQRREGSASTEIIFHVAENGETSTRIQRNRGTFQDLYNISSDSALLLQAYLGHILSQGKQEYNVGTMTDNQMRALFH